MRHLDEHLDEGTIHAWLDGALSADEAARVERHVAACAECAAQVAEARGFMAGASRILSALDETPAVAPATWGAGRQAREAGLPTSVHPRPSARRFRWSRPGVLAAAASVVVVLGTALIVERGVVPTSRAVPGAAMSARNTEAADLAAGSGAASGETATAAAPRVGAATQDAAVGGTASAPSPEPVPATRRREAPAAAAGIRPLAGSAPAVRRGVAGGQAAAENAVAQRAAPSAPVTLAPPPAAADGGRRPTTRPLAPPLSDAIVTAAGPDTTAARREIAPRAAVGRRAAGRQAVAPEVARLDEARESQPDTLYIKGRTDTVIVTRPSRSLGLRAEGSAAPAERALRITGCYEVLEGGLPMILRLTGRGVWSGAAEHAFVAETEGAIGYWSQPSDGNIHLVIAGTVVRARIDPATGELRGRVHRGRKVQQFVAQRCK